jgi:3D (Asp-Asp-Asp) domain-containing protein
LLTLLASLLCASIAIAYLHIEPGSRAVVFGVGHAGLTVREGPGYTYPHIDVLAEGAEVDVLSGPNWKGYVPWYRVGGYDETGKQGWMAGNYLQPKPAPTPEQEVDLEAEAMAEPGSEQAETESGTEAEAAPAAAPARVVTPSTRGGQRESRGFVALVTGYSIQGRTASGAPTRWGLVAVDPNIIPLGTHLRIDGFDEVFVAADTGGAVKGNWIDIYFPTYSEAARFGIQARQVTILEP